MKLALLLFCGGWIVMILAVVLAITKKNYRINATPDDGFFAVLKKMVKQQVVSFSTLAFGMLLVFIGAIIIIAQALRC